MISEAPLSAAAAFDNLSEQVKAYIATAKLAASGLLFPYRFPLS